MPIKNKEERVAVTPFVISTICFFIITSLFYLLIIDIKPSIANSLSVAEIKQTDLSEESVLLSKQIADWYPGQLCEPEDFLNTSSMETDSEAKYGTYRIVLNIPAHKNYGITGFTSDYAQRVYVNGELLSQVGEVSVDSEQFMPKTDYYSVYFTPQTDTTEIIIQVAYHNHAYGHLKDIYLAEQQVITERNRAEFLSNGLIIGALLAFAIFFLGMFCSYTERRSFLWFALACLCAALRYSIYFSKDIMVLLPNVSWYVIHKIEYLSHICFYYFLVLHALSVMKLKIANWVKYSFFGGFGAICIYYGIMPSVTYTKYVFVIGVMITALLLVITGNILLCSYRNKIFDRKENLIVGSSLILMVVSWLVEALTYHGISWYAQPYITLLIVFFNAVALTMQFSRTERELARSKIREHEIAQNAAMLEQINTMKTDFFQKMAHEIKTPLSIMSGYAQLTNRQITTGEVNAETSLNLKVISSEAKRLSELVANLMEMPTTPIAQAVLSELPVAEYLHYVSVVCRGLLEKKGNKLIMKGNTDQYILGNMEMLVQMMINLAVNSNRYMVKGKFTIEAAKENNSDYLSLIVSDTGCGISKEYADKIFEKGFTTNGTKGLGLSICKEIAHLHKGDIVLLTDNKEGAMFKITIPTHQTKE